MTLEYLNQQLDYLYTEREHLNVIEDNFKKDYIKEHAIPIGTKVLIKGKDSDRYAFIKNVYVRVGYWKANKQGLVYSFWKCKKDGTPSLQEDYIWNEETITPVEE